MRYPQLQNYLLKIARIFTIAAGLLFAVGMSRLHANDVSVADEVAKPTALVTTGGLDYLLAAHPVVGKVGQRRILFLNQPRPICPPYEFSLDSSAIETNNLVVLRKITRIVLCPSVGNPPVLARFEFEITPTKAGTLTIRDETSGAEITIQTLPASVPSKFDTNGMWFDAATTGSGIALITSVAQLTWRLERGFSITTMASRAGLAYNRQTGNRMAVCLRGYLSKRAEVAKPRVWLLVLRSGVFAPIHLKIYFP